MNRSDANIIEVNPFRCRVWGLHPRLDEHITPESCKAEIESFESSGQLIAVLGRRLTDRRHHDFEIIYGARRLFIARHLNRPLLVDVRELSDREALIAMDAENRHRKDISPFERGVSYARWLKDGYFQSQDEISRALHISRSQVSRLLKIAKLPCAVLNAFPSKADLCEGWGLRLASSLNDPIKAAQLIAVAREIADGDSKPAPKDVYRRLRAAGSTQCAAMDQVVADRGGKPLFRIKRRKDEILLLLPSERISASVMRVLESALTRIVEQKAHRAQRDGTKSNFSTSRVHQHIE